MGAVIFESANEIHADAVIPSERLCWTATCHSMALIATLQTPTPTPRLSDHGLVLVWYRACGALG